MTLTELQKMCNKYRKTDLPISVGQIIEIQNGNIKVNLMYLRKERTGFVFKEIIGDGMFNIFTY